MRVIKVAISVFLFGCITFSVPARAVVIEPSNIVQPDWPDSLLFSFDLVRSDSEPFAGRTFEAWMSVSGPGILTGDETNSKAVAGDPDYWLFENSQYLEFVDRGSNTYSFADYPADGADQGVAVDDILARYAFTWDGTIGDYTFEFPTDGFGNIDVAYSYISDEFWVEQPLELPDPQTLWYSYPIVDATDTSFTINIVPEPTTLLLLGFGSLILLKKRRP